MLRTQAQGEPTELEADVVRAAKAGDAHARHLLVLLYQDRVFRLLRRIVSPTGGDDALVEDLAQDTFLRALAALPSFDLAGPARLSTWLLTIATRLAIDALREASRRQRHLTAVDGLSAAAAPGDRTEARLLATQLANAVDGLAPQQRAVFVLREYHGMDYEEIAAALRIPSGTVASRLARARASLRDALEGGGR